MERKRTSCRRRRSCSLCFLFAIGKSVAEFFSVCQAGYKSQGLKDAWMFTPEGGETIKELGERAGKYLEVRIILISPSYFPYF